MHLVARALDGELGVDLLDARAAGAEVRSKALHASSNSSLALSNTLAKALGALEAGGNSTVSGWRRRGRCWATTVGAESGALDGLASSGAAGSISGTKVRPLVGR